MVLTNYRGILFRPLSATHWRTTVTEKIQRFNLDPATGHMIPHPLGKYVHWVDHAEQQDVLVQKILTLQAEKRR